MRIVKIAKSKEEFLSRKHPWIFSGAIESKTDDLTDGELVRICNSRNEFHGIGYFQPGTIAVRLLSLRDVKIDQEFWNFRVSNAIELRKKLKLINSNNNICRIIHGEGDRIPGLIVDYYNGSLIFQAHTVGIYQMKEFICQALLSVLGEKVLSIYDKSAETLPKRIMSTNNYLYGSLPCPHIAYENGIKFSIDWITGQKTGFFIDQRENRKLLGSYVKGKKVLNTFCYSGGFSIYALINGAELVESIDSSKKAIELLEQNLKMIEFSGSHKSIVADAIPFMNSVADQYDVIILDPPAFAKHSSKRHQAIKAYTRLNANAIRQIKTGGIIFTFSCSQVVDFFQFQKVVMAASIQCQRNVRILHQLHQPSDHPISVFHPEGDYLKGLVIQVD